MTTPNDQSGDGLENMPLVRARVPEHIARGEISTGVIVVTGNTEFLLDFVRNLPRPSTVVARVVLPHWVMPQFIEALGKNIELFRQRYGELPGSTPPAASVPQPITSQVSNPTSGIEPASGQAGSGTPQGFPPEQAAVASGGQSTPPGQVPGQSPAPPTPPTATNPVPLKRQNPQDIYDELKLRDEILSGAYANAVMIGHGPYEFSFDFITNFYPQSAVSCRVYLASGHIARLLDSLKQSWEQLRPRLGYPPSGSMGPS